MSTLPNAADPAWRWTHAYDAKVLLRRGRPDRARASASAALALSQQQAIDPSASLFVGEDLVTRAEASQALGDGDSARNVARLAMAHLTAIGATGSASMARARAIAAARDR